VKEMSRKETVLEKGATALLSLKQNLKPERDSLCDENVLTAVEELRQLFSSVGEKLTTQQCKLFEASLKAIFLSNATKRLDEIFGRPDVFVVLESFVGSGPPLLSLEVLLDSLKQGKVSTSMFLTCLRRIVSKGGLIDLLDNISTSQTTRDISLVVSLPDRIFNCVKKESISFSSKDYYENLFNAILTLQVGQLSGRISSTTENADILFSTLLSRICAIGLFKDFVRCCISFCVNNHISNPTKLTSLLASMSPAFMEKMLLDLMATVDSSEESFSFVRFCYVEISRKNAFSRKHLVLFVPRRQLISTSSISILLEIFLQVCEESERHTTLDEYLQFWSSFQFISSQNIPYQFQITRILLLFLRDIDLEYLQSPKTLQLLTSGVQYRLGNTNADIRYMGWVIGKQLGRSFGVDDSVLAEGVENFQPSQDLENLECLHPSGIFNHKLQSNSSHTKDTNVAYINNAGSKTNTCIKDNMETTCSESCVEDDKNADKSTFLEAYSVSDEESDIDSDNEDADLSKNTERAPSSVTELLNLFRKFQKQETEESWSLSLFVKGLEQLQSMISRRSHAVKGFISELVIALFLMDPDAVSPCKESSKLAELRRCCLLALAELSPLYFFRSLISKIFQSDNAHLTDKCRVLALLVDACQQLSGNCPEVAKDSSSAERSIERVHQNAEVQERFVGTVLKMLHYSLSNVKQQDARLKKNR